MTTIPKLGLSDTTQALLMFAALFLVPLVAWLGLGAPTDRTALGLLGSELVTAVIVFIKEIMGAATAGAATTAVAPAKA